MGGAVDCRSYGAGPRCAVNAALGQSEHAEFTPSRSLAGRRTPGIPRSQQEVIDHMGHDEVAAHSDVYGEIAGIRDFQSQEL